MIYLVEHFYSIQGEGKYLGRPSVFFRFGGCNLTCKGFGCREFLPDGTELVGCDTLYAVSREFSKNWVPIKNSSALVAILKRYDLDFCVDIVFTGGEPLINANDKEFVAFLEYLVHKGHRVTFETNATILPDFAKYPVYKECVYALSVKLANSLEPYEKRIKPEVIAKIALKAKEAFFKFSIDKNSIDASLDTQIEEITSYAPLLEVYCMPVGGSKKMVEHNTLALIEYVKAKGYIYSDRLHIRIWDENKGV